MASAESRDGEVSSSVAAGEDSDSKPNSVKDVVADSSQSPSAAESDTNSNRNDPAAAEQNSSASAAGRGSALPVNDGGRTGEDAAGGGGGGDGGGEQAGEMTNTKSVMIREEGDVLGDSATQDATAAATVTDGQPMGSRIPEQEDKPMVDRTPAVGNPSLASEMTLVVVHEPGTGMVRDDATTMSMPVIPVASTADDQSEQGTTITMPASAAEVSATAAALHENNRALSETSDASAVTAPAAVVVQSASNLESLDFDGLDDIIGPGQNSSIAERSPGGRYIRFMEKLGSGASKDVYRAYDTQEGIEVAWNVVNLAGVPKTERNRIVNEVRLLERLHHQNIISFHGSWVNRERQEVNFVTEILSSGTLKSFIKKVQVIRWKIAKRWAVQILKGLEYLHSQDPPVIHRDLKCENIFINGTSGDLRIGDLGLSTVHRNGKVLSVLGTPEFMAPDMYEENSYDEKVDIYAFGMCLLEIFTKEIPYSECSNPAQIYKRVTRGQAPEVLNRLQSKHARDFINFCLGHKDEDGTYIRPTATELLAHEFLLKRPTDEEEVGVEPSLMQRTIGEALSETYPSQSKHRISDEKKLSSSRENMHKPPPPTTAATAAESMKRSTSSGKEGGGGGAPSSASSSKSPSKAQPPQPRSNSVEEDESDRFEEMPDSEVNIKKVKVMMGRDQELEEDDDDDKEDDNDGNNLPTTTTSNNNKTDGDDDGYQGGNTANKGKSSTSKRNTDGSSYTNASNATHATSDAPQSKPTQSVVDQQNSSRSASPAVGGKDVELPKMKAGKDPAEDNAYLQYLVAAVVLDNEPVNLRPYADDILKLVITLPLDGQTQNVQFDFHLVQDDPVKVAKEMVTELGIPQGAVLEISETISALACSARMRQDKHPSRQDETPGAGAIVAPATAGAAAVAASSNHGSGQAQRSVPQTAAPNAIQVNAQQPPTAPPSQQQQQQPQPQPRSQQQQQQPHHIEQTPQQQTQHQQQQQSQPQVQQSQGVQQSFSQNAGMVQSTSHQSVQDYGTNQQQRQPTHSISNQPQSNQLHMQGQHQTNAMQQQQVQQQHHQQQASQHHHHQPQQQQPPPMHSHQHQNTHQPVHGQTIPQQSQAMGQHHQQSQTIGQHQPQQQQQQQHRMSDGQQRVAQSMKEQATQMQPAQQHQSHHTQQQQQVPMQHHQQQQHFNQHNVHQVVSQQPQPQHQQIHHQTPSRQHPNHQHQNQGMTHQNQVPQGDYLSSQQPTQQQPQHHHHHQQHQHHHQQHAQQHQHNHQQHQQVVSQNPAVPLQSQAQPPPQQQQHQHSQLQQHSQQPQSMRPPAPAPAQFQQQQVQPPSQQQTGATSMHATSHVPPHQNVPTNTVYSQHQPMQQMTNTGMPTVSTNGDYNTAPSHAQNQPLPQPQHMSHVPTQQLHQNPASSNPNPSHATSLQSSAQASSTANIAAQNPPSRPPSENNSPSQTQPGSKLTKNPSFNSRTIDNPNIEQQQPQQQSGPGSAPKHLPPLHTRNDSSGASRAHADPQAEQLSTAATAATGNSSSTRQRSSSSSSESSPTELGQDNMASLNGIKNALQDAGMTYEDLDEEELAELRRLDEEMQKTMLRAKKVFVNRMDNLQRTQSEREAQHKKTLEKHKKERVEFEKRMQQEAIEQNRRLEQLKREYDMKRKQVRQKQSPNGEDEEGDENQEHPTNQTQLQDTQQPQKQAPATGENGGVAGSIHESGGS